MKGLWRRGRDDDNRGSDVVLVFNKNIDYAVHSIICSLFEHSHVCARCTDFAHSTRAGATPEGMGLWRVALAKRRAKRGETGGIEPQSDGPFAQRRSRAPCTPGGAVPVRSAMYRQSALRG